jgi:hypothetical protein
LKKALINVNLSHHIMSIDQGSFDIQIQLDETSIKPEILQQG